MLATSKCLTKCIVHFRRFTSIFIFSVSAQMTVVCKRSHKSILYTNLFIIIAREGLQYYYYILFIFKSMQKKTSSELNEPWKWIYGHTPFCDWPEKLRSHCHQNGKGWQSRPVYQKCLQTKNRRWNWFTIFFEWYIGLDNMRFTHITTNTLINE